MAAKRQRTELGGGTGDIKPQFFTLNSGTMSADTYDVVQFALPVPRFGTMKTKATVFEILSLDWYLGVSEARDGTHTIGGYLTTSTTRVDSEPAIEQDFATDLSRPQTIGMGVRVNVSNAAASGAFSHQMPIHIDTTDGAGNGILVATDSIFLVTANTNLTQDTTSTLKMKYRLTNIGISEYVGIVQSQQA